MHHQFIEIQRQFEAQNYGQAEQIALQILRSHPLDYDVLKALGEINLVQEKNDEAQKYFEQCLKLNGSDYDVINNQSYVNFEMGDFEKSVYFSEKAIEQDPNRYNAYINLAKVFFIQRNYQKTVEIYQKTIDLAGGIEYLDTFTIIDYLDALLANNNKELCIKSLNNIQEKNFNSDLFFYKVSLDPNLITQKELDIAEGCIAKANLEKNLVKRSETLIGLYFGLANFFLNSDLKDIKMAESFFYKANREINKILRYMPLNEQKRTTKIKKTFLKKFDLNVSKDRGEGLIFIVGLPRSGTTLLESIVASHSDVLSLGELTLGTVLSKKLIALEHDTLNAQDIEEFGNEYLKRVSFLKGNQPFSIDKLPSNYNIIGLIRLALPGAKILHISRDKWDNAISLFQQRYVKNVPYASSFFNIALIISNYCHIIDFWKKNDYYENVLDIRYEELVGSELEISNKIFKFCGLSSSYVPENRQNFFSSTASKNQVSAPIHQKSIKKTIFEDSKDEFYQALKNQDQYWLSTQ